MLCHCGGDIEDCEFDGTPEQARCGHCEDRDTEYDDDPTEIEDERQFRATASSSIDKIRHGGENL
jgi:hypothetical protein